MTISKSALQDAIMGNKINFLETIFREAKRVINSGGVVELVKENEHTDTRSYQVIRDLDELKNYKGKLIGIFNA